MTAGELTLAAIVMAIGACLQGAVGFGSNLVAAPLLLLLSRTFVPGPVIVASLLLNLFVLRREGAGSVDARIGPAIVGQVPGAILAGVVFATVPERGLSLLFAAMVLAAVALSAVGRQLPMTRPALVGAGATSAFMGTISGIGGPPMAMVFQRLPGPALRGTLSRFFLIGGVVSLATLLVVGRLGGDEVVPALVLLPGTAAGFALSGPLARRVDRGAVRPVVLVLSAVSAVAVVVRELW